MSAIPTVKIKHPDKDGFMIVNQEDFNPEIHTPYDDYLKAQKAEADAKAKSAKSDDASGERAKK